MTDIIPIKITGTETIEQAYINVRAEKHRQEQERSNMESKETNPKDLVGINKAPLHLFPTTARMYGCLAFLEGALKYGRTNYRVAGVKASIYYDALNRHMDSWFEGEDIDIESGLPHLAKAIACIAILIEAVEAKNLNDDRVFPTKDFPETLRRVNALTKNLLNSVSSKIDVKHYTIQDKELPLKYR